ncbi:MAG: hypothetical protein GF341_04925 [candidate division Zixibacteria bacterium]|nr:hypothetical protein [candidate division Zixibacteria bacterium]
MLGCSSTAPPPEGGLALSEATRNRLQPNITDISVSPNGAVVEWQVDRQRDDVIRGYNVYVGRQPGLDQLSLDNERLDDALHNQSTYPGDTDGDIRSESIVLQRLETGERYYVHVRTVFPGGQASPPSEERVFMPRPQGVITLHPRLSGLNEGYSFTNDTTVELRSLQNDLYIYTIRDTAFLASPSRLSDGLRTTRFVNLGYADEFTAYPEMSSANGVDKVALDKGQVLGVRLNDDRIAKLRVVSIDKEADPMAVTFQYRYQPVAGETRF